MTEPKLEPLSLMPTGGRATGAQPREGFRRTSPAALPWAAPWPALAVITDTNVLATSACYAAKNGDSPLLSRIGLTGRAPLLAGAHVPEEIGRHLPRIARNMGVPVDAARDNWLHRIGPAVRFVDLPIREHLRPEIASIRHSDPALPTAQQGDPDDLPTAALASFLAPAVIVTADRVFARFGLASSEDDWFSVARDLLSTAGYEASYVDGIVLTELMIRLLTTGARSTWQLFERQPIVGIGLVGALLMAWRRGRVDPALFRAAARRLGESAQPALEQLVTASTGHASARGSLVIVEDPPWRKATVPERCARLLAHSTRALTASEIRDSLNPYGTATTAAECRRSMIDHPAFKSLPADRFELGRPASRLWSARE